MAAMRATAWFFGMASAAAAGAGLAVVGTAPPIFLAMTALLLACAYALAMLREYPQRIAHAALMLALGWLALTAWPLYAPYAWRSDTLLAALIAGCALLRGARWLRAGSGAPAAVISAGGWASLAGVAMASNAQVHALGPAVAAQVELLASGADAVVMAWLATPLRLPPAADADLSDQAIVALA
ncbi:MAG TPA: hypothetical protein VJQ49_09910 [Casimicrobiaceae bacterium]|nr:hypothetical protein [Casimicrobiaceae bacterium]